MTSKDKGQSKERGSMRSGARYTFLFILPWETF